jgi:hypothetical protein
MEREFRMMRDGGSSIAFIAAMQRELVPMRVVQDSVFQSRGRLRGRTVETWN